MPELDLYDLPIGTVIRIKDDPPVLADGWPFIEKMRKYLGQFATITENKRRGYGIDIGNSAWGWSPEFFTVVSFPTPPAINPAEFLSLLHP